MYVRSHAIIRLAIHLPLIQKIYFNAGKLRAAVEQIDGCDTMFTAWFKLNASDAEAKQHLYFDIPHHYVYHKHIWKKRNTRGEQIIPGIYAVNPSDIERFIFDCFFVMFLALLLSRI